MGLISNRVCTALFRQVGTISYLGSPSSEGSIFWPLSINASLSFVIEVSAAMGLSELFRRSPICGDKHVKHEWTSTCCAHQGTTSWSCSSVGRSMDSMWWEHTSRLEGIRTNLRPDKSSSIEFFEKLYNWGKSRPNWKKNTFTTLESSAVALRRNFSALWSVRRKFLRCYGVSKLHFALKNTLCGKTVHRTSYLHQQQRNGCSGKTAQNN